MRRVRLLLRLYIIFISEVNPNFLSDLGFFLSDLVLCILSRGYFSHAEQLEDIFRNQYMVAVSILGFAGSIVYICSAHR